MYQIKTISKSNSVRVLWVSINDFTVGQMPLIPGARLCAWMLAKLQVLWRQPFKREGGPWFTSKAGSSSYLKI